MYPVISHIYSTNKSIHFDYSIPAGVITVIGDDEKSINGVKIIFMNIQNGHLLNGYTELKNACKVAGAKFLFSSNR